MDAPDPPVSGYSPGDMVDVYWEAPTNKWYPATIIVDDDKDSEDYGRCERVKRFKTVNRLPERHLLGRGLADHLYGV